MVNSLTSDDQVSLQDWFSSSEFKVEEFNLDSGDYLDVAAVNNLVEALAAIESGDVSGANNNLDAEQMTQYNAAVNEHWKVA